MLRSAIGTLTTALLAWMLIDQYVVCPTYAFRAPEPFRGDSLYNPYRGFREEEWTMANFHAHTASWFGLTNGKGGESDLHNAYDSMGYGIRLISDYQKINRHGDSEPGYISAYEHGYNLPKAHHLVLGSASVVWKDYFLPQTLSNKQDLLDRLAEPGNAVVINHPAMRTGFRPADLKFLENYDALEVLNSYKVTFDYWDAALSSGKMVSIVGNDDTHNAGKRTAIGKFATLVHAPARKREEVLRSIREGRTIGVWIPHQPPIPFPEKIRAIRAASPAIQTMTSDSGILRLSFRAPVYELALTGQGGRVLVSKDSLAAGVMLERPFAEADTYVRVSYRTADGIRYFLNPIARYDGKHIGNRRAGTPGL
jgi:hypothetical protein